MEEQQAKQDLTDHPLRVLLVEDESSLRGPLAKRLRGDYGYKVDPAADLEEARGKLEQAERPYDVALIDDLLAPRPGEEPEYVGLDLLQEVNRRWPETEVIVFTGWGMDRALEVLRAGAYRYLEKPFKVDELGMTIRMAAEQARLRRERDLLSAVLEISRAMLSELDIEKILQVIVEAVPKLVGAEACAVARVDPTTGRVQHEPVVLLGDVEVRWRRHLRGVELTRRIIETGEVYALPDVDACAEEVDENLRRAGVKSFVGVPIPGQPQNLGVLYAYSTRREAFGADQQRVLDLLAGQAAIALQNARLYKEERRRADEAEVMLEVGQALDSTLDLDHILQTIVRKMAEVTGVKQSGVVLFDEAQEAGYVAAEYQETPDDTAAKVRIPLRGNPSIDRILDTKEPLAIYDAENDPLTAAIRDVIRLRSIQSILIAPLVVKGRVIGTIGLDATDERRHFTSEEIRLCKLMATQAAAAIDRAQLLRQVEKARQAAQVVAAVTVQEDLQKTLNTIVQRVRQTLQCDAVAIYSYDQTKDKLGPRAIDLVDARTADSASPPEEPGPASAVWSILKLEGPERYRLTEDYAADHPLFGGEFTRSEDIRAVLGIQLRIGGQRIGTMFVNYRSPHRFSRDEIAMVKLFADQAAVAIRNAQLYEETARRANTLQALNKAGQAVTGSLSLDDILNRIVEQAWHFTGRQGRQARFSYLALVDGSKLRLKVAYPAEHLAGPRGRVGEIDLEQDERIGITGRAVKTGRSQLVGDVTQDPDYIEYDPETRSELAVPIKLGEEIIGGITVAHSDDHAFDKDDQRDLESLAAWAAIAIQNARRYEELRHTKGLIGARTALAWMGMVSSEWRHRIRNQAQTIQEQVQLSRRDLGSAPAHDHHTALEDRLSRIERLAAQIQEKPIIPPLSSEEGVVPFAINDLVGERARQLWRNDPYRETELRLDLRLDNAAKVRASPEWLRRAFDILADNAVEATAGCEVRCVTVVTRPADGGVEIAISDTGRGIPPEVQSRLFERQIDRPQEAKGFGIGLLIAQAIVETYGGKIDVESTGPTGTTMTIWLPLAA